MFQSNQQEGLNIHNVEKAKSATNMSHLCRNPPQTNSSLEVFWFIKVIHWLCYAFWVDLQWIATSQMGSGFLSWQWYFMTTKPAGQPAVDKSLVWRMSRFWLILCQAHTHTHTLLAGVSAECVKQDCWTDPAELCIPFKYVDFYSHRNLVTQWWWITMTTESPQKSVF